MLMRVDSAWALLSRRFEMSALMTNVMRTGSLDAADEETVCALYRAIFLTDVSTCSGSPRIRTTPGWSSRPVTS